MFKKEQRVMVIGAHVNGSDMEGVFSHISREYGNEGKYVIDLGFTNLVVESERVMDLQEYTDTLREANKDRYRLLGVKR